MSFKILHFLPSMITQKWLTVYFCDRRSHCPRLCEHGSRGGKSDTQRQPVRCLAGVALPRPASEGRSLPVPADCQVWCFRLSSTHCPFSAIAAWLPVQCILGRTWTLMMWRSSRHSPWYPFSVHLIPGLTTEQMLLKDMKAVSGGDLALAVSVVYMTLDVSRQWCHPFIHYSLFSVCA